MTESDFVEIPKGKYFIINTVTGRYLSQLGEEFTGTHGEEGGWKDAPLTVAADKNYQNRACFHIKLFGTSKSYIIESVKTNRWVFDTGDKLTEPRQSEKGWAKASKIVGTDEDYYHRALWKFHPTSDADHYIIENHNTQRYLFHTGEKIESEGAERGIDKAPPAVGADANYYHSAEWRLELKEKK